ncbi:unnamed protein product [Microthlaspi erraticum]|uniref:Uncharacterized protein n=1 Tax=Microthlaspi erraticum TaxID=1685480 RepID=A0A6D2I5V6_9BRAS|nr:unnamed protein product [Microthlaspi erraticum]
MVDDHNDRVLWDCGSPLYDSYELVSLTHTIERHFMSLPSLAGAGKVYSSRTPSDLGAKANRAAITVVDLCCPADSTAGKVLCGVFRKRWWKRKKNADLAVAENNNKKTLFCRIFCGMSISTTRSGSPKM